MSLSERRLGGSGVDMGRGFFILMAAQFFSALGDNALLIAAISALREAGSSPATEPLLKTSFTVSYVALAAFVGVFADSMRKRDAMFIGNTIKLAGGGAMLAGVHPLGAYALAGLGAAVYSPAKYGILTEMLPREKLVRANGWIEVLTIAAIILGVALGGTMFRPGVSEWLLSFDFPLIDTTVDTPPEAAMAVVGMLYVVAAALNTRVPDTRVELIPLPSGPWRMLSEFGACNAALWKDRPGRTTLASTTLFWGAGAALQFIILDWAKTNMSMGLAQASLLQAVVAGGVALGAAAAAGRIPISRAVRVIPAGVAAGVVMLPMPFVHSLWAAVPLLVATGAMSGLLIVPMNALLQNRGASLMGAGRSIAVQNFNENMSILVMTGVYSAAVASGLTAGAATVGFGVFMAGALLLVKADHDRAELAAGATDESELAPSSNRMDRERRKKPRN